MALNPSPIGHILQRAPGMQSSDVATFLQCLESDDVETFDPATIARRLPDLRFRDALAL